MSEYVPTYCKLCGLEVSLPPVDFNPLVPKNIISTEKEFQSDSTTLSEDDNGDTFSLSHDISGSNTGTSNTSLSPHTKEDSSSNIVCIERDNKTASEDNECLDCTNGDDCEAHSPFPVTSIYTGLGRFKNYDEPCCGGLSAFMSFSLQDHTTEQSNGVNLKTSIHKNQSTDSSTGMYTNTITSLNSEPVRICLNCGTTETKLWRTRMDGTVLCNPCGLYERVKGISRPLKLTRRKKFERTKKTVTVAK